MFQHIKTYSVFFIRNFNFRNFRIMETDPLTPNSISGSPLSSKPPSQKRGTKIAKERRADEDKQGNGGGVEIRRISGQK